MLRKSSVIGVILFLLTFGAQAYGSLSPDIAAKITPALSLKLSSLKFSEQSTQFPVLVTLKAQADLSQAYTIRDKHQRRQFVYDQLTRVARESQKNLLTALEQESLRYRRFYIANMVAVYNATTKTVMDLALRADVSKIDSDKTLLLEEPGDFETTLSIKFIAPSVIEPNIEAVRAPGVWQDFGAQGEGIVVGGQDTGIDWDHPALIAQYRGNANGKINHDYNWHDAIHTGIEGAEPSYTCPYNSPEPCDDNGHGTHTLGTVLGQDEGGYTTGMAPKAKWIGCRNMDGGVGRSSTYIECFEFFMAPYPVGGDPLTQGDPTLAADVTNNSWGCPASEGCTGDEFVQVLAATKAAGIMTVASAGNEGPGCSTIQDGPAHNSATTFSVGAVNHVNNQIAYFSSRGPSAFDGALGPDISAPGVNIRSAIPGGNYSSASWSGTSMAGPHVAGLVALLWSYDASLAGQVDYTGKIIQDSATPQTSNENCGGVSGNQVPNNTYGWGIINAYEAVKSLSN